MEAMCSTKLLLVSKEILDLVSQKTDLLFIVSIAGGRQGDRRNINETFFRNGGMF
jgi:hypothetical protein